MMRQYELVERVARYNPRSDEALLNKAYVYAMHKHGEQRRASGDPYFSHPLEVAGILTDLRLDDATIAVALLHDTIEDTDATRQEIDGLFGPAIGELVEGLTKIRRLDFLSTREKQAENFRKLLLAVADDVRVLLVKLADRLHNMRTIRYVPEEKRRAVAEETMEIYAPLAGRMGMQAMREELEELAFEVIEPDAARMVRLRLDDLRERNVGLIQEIEQDLTRRLGENGIEAEVDGREKRPYAIFSKMQRKSTSFEQLSDIYGFRVVVPGVADCYRVLGVAHTTWPTVPGRFKDYISTPKQNDYRSIHTTVVGPSRQRVELQIRTPEMHRTAEYGIAAHALYKDGLTGGRNLAKLDEESRAYAWLRRTIDLLADGENSEEFLEHTKLELFHDQVFCFTPKGRLITLPRGATPIDFAYAVHTDVGNTCIGAKINGQMKPIVTELRNGDEVEILRSDVQTAVPAWQTVAVTGKARAAIRRATRAAAKRQYAALGEHMLKTALQKRRLEFDRSDLSHRFLIAGHASVDDVLASIGEGKLDAETVAASFQPAADAAEPGIGTDTGINGNIPEALLETIEAYHPLPVRGIAKDMPVRFAPEGGAIPGDRIVGILTPGEGVTIYPIQSPVLEAFDEEPDRWLDVRWDVEPDADTLFPAMISVETVNAPGSLAQIAQTIADAKGNIDNVRFTRRGTDFHTMQIVLEVRNLKHLNLILQELKARPAVSDVTRING